MILRHARLSDAPLLRYWDGKPHVIASSGDDDEFDWDLELPRNSDWRELLLSNTRVQPFYERLGFRCIGRRMYGDDDCLVYQLERGRWLKQAGSTARRHQRQG